MSELSVHFALNFNTDIFHCIAGAELMETLGYDLPDSIINASIQRFRLKADVEAVETMIERYNEIVQSLRSAQVFSK